MKTMLDERDNGLIAEYDARRSDDAFAALVRRHINLVFATALRQVGDTGAAEEITQNVFVALAQASGKLKAHPTIAGWLHQTTLNKSHAWLRSELRHRHREQVAVHQQLADAEGDSVWSPLVPLLDEALLKLREPDRLAVVMHFMEGRTFEEVGTALGIGEDTVRKRVNRCLHELTHFFQRRGFAVPTLTAATPLFALASYPTPAGLAASVTTASLAAAHSAASTSTLTLLKGALKIMAWTKTKTAVTAAVILALTATGVDGYKIIRAHYSPTELLAGNWDIQPDGVCLVSARMEAVNTFHNTIRANHSMSMESGMDIEQFTDGTGQDIKYTKQPGDDGNAFKYTYTLNRPVPPGGKMVMVLQGTLDGQKVKGGEGKPLIQAVGGPNEFQFHDREQMGDDIVVHRQDTFLLPLGAILLQMQPADMTTNIYGGRIKIHFDKMLPPPNIMDVTLRYRFAAGAP